MDSASKPSIASGGPSSARQAWHSGAGASPNDANPTQVPAPELRAAGADSSRRWSGVQEPGYSSGQFAQVPPVIPVMEGYPLPQPPWGAVSGGYPLPQTQSAQVPPVAGVYPLPQARYRTVPLPYQSPAPEPLFEAVNPFEARRWRRPARPTTSTEPQSANSGSHWVQFAPDAPPPVIPGQPQPIQSGINPWMPSNAFLPAQPPQYHGYAYQPTQFQAHQTQLQSTDPANNPVWGGPNAAWGAPVLNPAFPVQATAYPRPANEPAYGPTVVATVPVQSFPQASGARASIPINTIDSESEVDSVEEAAEAMRRSRPPGACARCKQLKVKCEFETGTIPCKRCFNGGHDCVIPGRNKRGAPLKEHQEVGTQIPEQTTETQQLGEGPSQPPPIPVGQPHDVSLPSVRHSTSTPILPTSKPDQPSPSSSFLDNIDATRPSYVSLPESVSMFYGIPSVQGTPSVLATPSSLAESIARIPSPPCERMQSSQPSLLSQISASEYSAASPPQAPSTGRARYPTYPSSPGVFATIPTPANGLPPPVVSMSRKSSPLQTAALAIVLVLFDFIPRQLYLHFLLRIPSLYFSRVTRIFEDARLSLPDIKRMARARPDQWNNPSDMFWQPSVQTPDQMPLPRSLLQFRSNWEGFIDSLMREWKTFNIISVLLLSAILTMLQIESASHPITRVSALLSLICALMSLLYGCMYIIRFGTMRKMHKASSFAGEAQKDTTSILWNIWVLLAMPAVWLAWSIISFLTCIMSFIWLTGTSQDQDDFAMSSRATLGYRLGLTLVFSLGIIYFVLIVNTFYQYGDPLDREWMRNVNEWMKEAASYPPPPQNLYDAQAAPVIPGTPFLRPESQRNPSYTSFWRVPPVSPFLKLGEGDVPRHFNRLPSFTRLTLKPSAFFKTPHPASSRPAEPLDIMHLRHPDVHVRLGAYDNPNWADAVTPSDFIRFELDVSNAWHGRLALTKPEDGASTDIPVYTLLSPARPENPVPTTESDAGLDAPAHAPARGIHSIASSETSYGPVLEPTRYVTARFSASETPVSRENPIPDGIGVLSTSLAQSLADDIGPGPSRAPQPAETSEVDPAPDPVQTVRELIDLWNRCYFHPRNLEASLVPRPDSSGPAFDVNLAWWSPAHLASEEHFDEKALNPPNDITKTASEPSFAGSFATAEDAHAPVP